MKNTIPNIWTAQEKVLHLYKCLSLGLGVIGFIMATALLISHFQSPLVVLRKAQEVEFYPSQRKPAPLEKPEVEAFTKQFLANLYVWNDFNGEKIARSIAPFSEEGLTSKVVGGQGQKYLKELGGKHLSQSLAFVEVSVLDDRVVCRFDRVLKIEGIPLVIPTEVTLSLIQGEPTRFNPMGIYVGGIKESENVK